MNSVYISGNLTRDIEIRETATNKIAFGSIAVDCGEKASFVNFTAYRGTAELMASMCKKGQLITIEGFLSTYTAQDNKTVLCLNVKTFLLYGKTKDEPKEATDESDLPF